EFGQGGVGLLLDEFAQPCFGRGIECACWHTAMPLGLHRACATLVLQESNNTRQADGEQLSDLAQREFAPLDRSDEAFPKIVRISAHGCTSLQTCPPKVLYSICDPSVNRTRWNGKGGKLAFREPAAHGNGRTTFHDFTHHKGGPLCVA